MADARGPLPSWLVPVTWALARVYGAGVAWRNARFDRGTGVERLEIAGVRVPVVSVGNLTAGGTGKSPFVAWVCAQLSRAGAQPVIAMRGYGADDPAHSDEAREYATTAPAAWLVVDPDRVAALRAALSRVERSDLERCVVVLDDGFQHRRLARDLDIVLVDASRPGLAGDLLPNGWLREPARNIARAAMVVLTKAHDGVARGAAASLVADVRGRAHDAACEHVWSGLTVHEQGVRRTECVEWLAGKRVLSACALGNPAHFHDMVGRAGSHIARRLERSDHDSFTAAELDAAALGACAEAIVLSRKDLVKLHEMPRTPVVVPELGLRFLEGEDAVLGAMVRATSGAATRQSAS